MIHSKQISRQVEHTRSLSLLQYLLDQSGDALVAALVRDGRIIYANEQAGLLFGYPLDMLTGRTALEFSVELQKKGWPHFVEKCRNSKQTMIETELDHRDGRRIPVEINVRYIVTGDNDYLVGVIRDISHRKGIESALKQSEHRFRALAEFSSVGVYLIQHGKMLYANPRLAQFFGYEPETIVNKPIVDLVHPDDFTEVQEQFRQGESGRSLKAPYGFRARQRDGTYFPVEIYGSMIDYEGEPAIIGTLLDITDRKQVEDALRESEKRLRLSQSYGGIGTWEADLVNNCQIWSVECISLNGFPPLQQPTWEDFLAAIHPEDRQSVVAATKNHLKFGTPYDVEYRIETRTGDIRWMRSVGHAEHDADGKPIRMRGIVQDVTRLHQVIEELQKSEARLKEAQHLAHIGNWELDLLERKFCCSDEAFCIFEIDKGQGLMTYSVFLQVVHPEDRAWVDSCFWESVTHRTALSLDHRLLFSDGRIKYVHQQCETIYDPAGVPLKSLGTVQDITVRKQTEAERQYFYNTLNASLNEIYIFKADTLLFEFVSQGALKNLGYSMDTMRHMTPLDLKPEFDRTSFAQLLKPLITGKVPVLRFETDHLRADGSLYPVEVHLQMIDQVGHRVFLAVILDISQRRFAEAKLRENEERLRLTLKAAHQGWYDLNVKTGEASVSPEYAEILGYAPETFRESLTKWIERMHPEDRAAVLSTFQAYIQGRVSEFRVEFRQKTRAGKWKWILSIGSIVERDEQGKPIRMLGTHRDITQRKRAEMAVRKLNEELEARVLERTEQLQAANQELETFTYTVSHDLKAPLRGIDGYSRLLQEECADKLEGDSVLFVENIRRGVRQMNDLIEDLLAYSQVERRAINAVKIQVAGLIEQVKLEKQTELDRLNVQLLVNLPEELTVRADFNGLMMVLRNLFDNALKFTRDVHEPVLEVGGRVAGNSCIIWLRDNGIGFDMKFHDRIFEIFQRLQRTEDYPGTGIGLTIVRKAMQRMGGRIWAESSPGQGATFYLELPS